ncbi:MAG: AarF/ABC1/UbiB kinase family protein [Nitrospiraceae bacterium]|nr:AarF/ABC1/UbiB kinase family protein [Nitrospiraceae bacterium]
MPLSFLKFGRRYRTFKRLKQIVNVFLKYEFGYLIDQIRLHKFIPIIKRLKTFGRWPEPKVLTVPERLRMAFAELGPSFIKLGQLLSSRPDLITTRYANEFKKLQDRVPPFSCEQVKRIIEEETGLPLNKIFSEFNENPIAAASIAQVHHGKLFDGSDVVIKVQRPDIREQIETDINILNAIAQLLDRHFPESRFFNPVGIVGEFAKTIRKEIDFCEEAKNCLKFTKNFQGNKDVYFPKLYSKYITEKILVMEKINGAKIDDIESIDRMGLDKKNLTKIGVDAYFKMVFEDGFFHADPHPGNIFAMPSGQIGFMDFGIVGSISTELREHMADTVIFLINKNFDKLVDQYIEMGLVPDDVDVFAFKKDFKTDIVEFAEPLYETTVGQLNFSQYMDAILHIAIKHKIKMPSDFLLVNKTMLVLEYLGRELDPDFNLAVAAEPYAIKFVKTKISASRIFEKTKNNIEEFADFIALFPRQLKHLMRKILKDDIHVKLTHTDFDKFIKDMDKSTNRISFSLVVSAIILSSSIMHAFHVGPEISGFSIPGTLAFIFAFLFGIWLVISILKSGRL